MAERTDEEDGTTWVRMVSHLRRDGEGGGTSPLYVPSGGVSPRLSGVMFARALRVSGRAVGGVLGGLGVATSSPNGQLSSCGDCTVPFSVHTPLAVSAKGSMPSSIFSESVSRFEDAVDCFRPWAFPLEMEAESDSELLLPFFKESMENSLRGSGLPPLGFFAPEDMPVRYDCLVPFPRPRVRDEYSLCPSSSCTLREHQYLSSKQDNASST